ncbi:hypothetical protein BD847_1753 [Flavobacterium cutihirudinis]|uniref:LysM domain-containing protein n=1 Tax=Flavobacterium cutihirudinis TaxID=1265740 RepID=A0A3D9FW73_9FLAO|nr:hypothetical protein [Flavobacterium cutihirudinis]RED25014.1 hypothetical protein BD847_1753 [Flavobacterium cutihirudinis]
MPELYIPDFSYSDYLTYEIKNDDTPESVAEKMGIDLYALRSYHNRYATLEDLIGPIFPRHLKFLIIKPEEKELTEEEKEQHRKNVVFNDGPGKLSLNYSHGEYTYAVLYTIDNGKDIYTIKQKITVIWLAQNKGYHCYKIHRDNDIYINDVAPNTMAQEITHQASQALYPLTIVVDQNGNWIDIYNFNEIEKRWQETKKQIRNYYKGHTVEKYFSIQDKNLESSDTLYASLNKDWFLNSLFNGIHVQYPSTKTINRKITFPYLAKSESINYQTEQVIDERLDVDNLIVININGKLNDERTKTDFENELNISGKEYSEEKPDGNYSAKYFLNPNNYMPEAFIVSCGLGLDIVQKYTISATNLHSRKELVIASRQSTYVGINKPKKRDYSLLYIILLIIASVAFVFAIRVFFLKQ